MNFKRFIAASIALAMLLALRPVAPAHADGKASTRNILLGGAAATLLIINHNRKVHQRYAEYEQRNAALAQQRNDAWAAYRSAEAAYEHEASVASELQREVAYQHDIIQQQRQQLAQAQFRSTSGSERAAAASIAVSRGHSVKAARLSRRAVGPPTRVAVLSYGWGSI
jgi:hypothetical protein